MPRLMDSLNVEVGRQVPPHGPVDAHRFPPVFPTHLQKGSACISSLPPIATDVDGITRQFYQSAGHLPLRRLILPL